MANLISYTFEYNKGRKKGQQFDLDMPSALLDEFLNDHPEVNRVFKMNIGDPTGMGITKPPSDFQKYILGRMKSSIPGNTIGDSSRFKIPKEL